MIEIRINGRGGQGAVTSAELLAVAAFKDGNYSQAFPNFGPARRGAPVEAYCRIDKKFINLRTQVYEPDYVIILDSGLAKLPDILKGLKNNGVVVVNTEKKPNYKYKTYFIDATSLAREILGVPIVNTVMLGAFIKASGIVTLGSLKEAIKERFPEKTATKNIEAVEEAYKKVKK